MPKTRPPYSTEFRQQIVELVRAGRVPAELSREFGCSAQSIANWVAQSAIDRGKPLPGKEGLTSAEREELVRLRREVRQLQTERDIFGKGYGLVRREGRQDVHTVFEVVKANQAYFPVQTMCRVLDVSTSGYYGWLQHEPSNRSIANRFLLERIRAIHAASDRTYGAPRVRAELLDEGARVSRKRIARLMRAQGLRGVSRRRGFIVTTRRDVNQPAAADLVNRRFVADGPNQLWVADLTYVPTCAGFIFLAVVLDVWSRRVVGWSIGERMAAELVLAALNMALEQRRPVDVIHHSDRGSQYTSVAFGQRCTQMGVRPSMGSVGDAYDSAMAESFFASLECELLDRRSFKSKAEARTALFSWIEGWYNPRRRHSALGYRSPAKFESERTAQMQKPHAEHELPTVGVCVACATPPVDNSVPHPFMTS